jgi:hypothetical protein
VKRSRKISLVLLGGLSAGALTSCAPTIEGVPRISPDDVYANNQFVEGAGYYHAPFNAFFPQPYNYFDPRRKQYFFGGQWGPVPHRSIINVSAPTPEAAVAAQAGRLNVYRSGFGSTGGRHSIWS